MTAKFFTVADVSGPKYDSSIRSLTAPSTASTAELLALILEMDVEQAWELIRSFGLQANLFDNQDATLYKRLRSQQAEALRKHKGMTERRLAKFAALQELAKRLYTAAPKKVVIDDPAQVLEVVGYEIAWSEIEHFVVIPLDVRNQVIAVEVMTTGTKTETCASPREVFEIAFRYGATRLIVAHNHPSGDCVQSEADSSITRILLQGAQVLNMQLLDHVIVSGNDYRSLRQHTNIWNEFPQST